MTIPMSNVSAGTVTVDDPGAGSRRGVFCFLHATQISDLALPLKTNPPSWDAFNAYAALTTDLVADNWLCTYPAYPCDWSVDTVSCFGNIYNDAVANGTGNVFVDTMRAWGDYYFTWQEDVYGASRPTIFGGFSLGAWASLILSIYGSPTGMSWPNIGYMAQAPATVWQNLTIFPNMNVPTWGNMDLSTTNLNAVTLPGLVRFSDTDATVGWALSSQSPVLGLTYRGVPQSNAYLMASNAEVGGQPVTIQPTASSTPGSNPVAYPNGHVMLPQDAAPIAAWVLATFPRGSFPVNF